MKIKLKNNITFYYKLNILSITIRNKFWWKPKYFKESTLANIYYFFYFLCFQLWISKNIEKYPN